MKVDWLDECRDNPPILFEVDEAGRVTVLASHALGHFRDTMRSIHAEADSCYRLWPRTAYIFVVGGEFHGYHMPRALWVDKIGKRN